MKTKTTIIELSVLNSQFISVIIIILVVFYTPGFMFYNYLSENGVVSSHLSSRSIAEPNDKEKFRFCYSFSFRRI